MQNPIIESIRQFSQTHGKTLILADRPWRYYRLGKGPAVLWLTGGLRRAAWGFGFLPCAAQRCTVISLDYPPVMTFAEIAQGIDAILKAEGIERFSLAGQSYGGILAQAYLALRPQAVEQLVLSNTGPCDGKPSIARVDDFIVLLLRILPERAAMSLLGKALEKVLQVPGPEQLLWIEALKDTLHNDLTRQDTISHFAVAGDIFRRQIVKPAAFADWQGKVVVLSSENDPTQGKDDRRRYESIFDRPVDWLSLGDLGHAAVLAEPERYSEVFFQALFR